MKTSLFLLILITFLGANAFAQTEFNQPWLVKSRPLIIDAYQGNDIEWGQLKTDPRVKAVIHRASIGMRVDTKYAARMKEAKKRGYLWGSYHLGKTGDPIKQAELYLSVAKPDSKDLMVIDIEAIGGSNMSLANAMVFAKHIRSKTGRLPLIYSNNNVTKHISDNFGRSNLFSKMPLWYARFRDEIPKFPSGTWKSYTLWQFACEINCAQYKIRNGKRKYDCRKTQAGCPYEVAGTDRCMDINVFYGDAQELSNEWPFT